MHDGEADVNQQQAPVSTAAINQTDITKQL